MIVPYTECQFQQVQPYTLEQQNAIQAQLASQQLAARQAVGLGCAGCGCNGMGANFAMPRWRGPEPWRGVGDYIDGFNWPIPQYLTPGNSRGLGAFMDGTGLLGTGLFSGGLDYSTWGIGEYLTILGGIWVVYSVFHTTGQAARYAAGTRSRYRKRKAEGYRKLASEYSKQ